MSAQYYPLADDPAGIDGEEGARGHEGVAAVCPSLEEQHGLGRVANWSKYTSNTHILSVEKLLKLQAIIKLKLCTTMLFKLSHLEFISRCVLGEDWSCREPPHPTMENKMVLQNIES
jgi:hypothetical protein